MIDTTIPAISLVMEADLLKEIPVFELPEGYSFRFYRPGDEIAWARIHVSTGAIENIEKALEAFRFWFPDKEGLEKRMIFLLDNGKPFATAAAWYGDGDMSTVGRVHWVAVDQDHQGKGLCAPLVSLTVERMKALGHTRAYLTTQTSSWVAIKVYNKFGFRPAISDNNAIEGWKIVSEKTGIDLL